MMPHVGTEKKTAGRVYTPAVIVRNILDLSGYRGEAILEKHVIDNSCGDGAFLTEIVTRYCQEASKAQYDKEHLTRDLETYIHGIEIDQTEVNKALSKVSSIASGFCLDTINWDIRQGDSLSICNYDNKMDFVLGNPPYVRVHNLADTYDTIKGFSFTKRGMTDLYIAFYELGLRMLNRGGVLGYITPSSLHNSNAAGELRAYLVGNRLVETVVDLKHYQPFEATTYTSIFVLRKEHSHRTVSYYGYDTDRQAPYFVDTLPYDSFYLNGNFYFGAKKVLDTFVPVLVADCRETGLDVKNGFATLLDSFFIGDIPFEEYTIPVVKASTGNRTRCLFPYDDSGKLLPYDLLSKNERVLAYYENNRQALETRSLTDLTQWYGFGRTQGILDVYKRKYSICPIVRTLKDLKVTLCDKGVGVYSGLYILTNYDKQIIENTLLTEDFMEYVALLGKYKSGGYYTFSSKDLKRYLVWKLGLK